MALLNFVGIGVGLLGLYFGGEWLVQGASRLARSFGIPVLIIGLTIVAFGTSTPELLVSISAAMGGSSAIAVGNVVGSNIANIGLILGTAGLISTLAVQVAFLRREIPFMIAVSIVLLVMFLDGDVSRGEGAALFTGLLAYLAVQIFLARREVQSRAFIEEEAAIEAVEEAPIQPTERLREVARVILGIAVLLVGARLTVDGAVALARAIGVSELAIGVTLVAVGTSLPELATSVVAAIRKEDDIAVGNVVGSNVFNILCILGAAAFLQPIHLVEPPQVGAPSVFALNPFLEIHQYGAFVLADSLVMIGFAGLLLPMSWGLRIGRKRSLALLVLYATFVIYIFAR